MGNYKKYLFFFILGLLVGIAAYFAFPHVLPSALPSVVAIFSPEEGDQIIDLIDSSKESLSIEMYVFTSDEIADALKRAHDRGVDVRLILEKRVATEDNPKNYAELKDYGIAVRWASTGYQLTHAKFTIVDGKAVLVGSHNFSNAAMRKNREASVIVTGSTVEEFKQVFEQDWILAG